MKSALLEKYKDHLHVWFLTESYISSSIRLSDDPFVQIMCIRKGKHLVARILPFLSSEQAAEILMATARNLPFLIKKDAQDEVNET